MSAWRPARVDELPALWPAARTAHLARSLAELEQFQRSGPWRLRVSSAGDAMLLRRWRENSGALAIRGAWAPEYRLAQLVEEARSVARSQGYGQVVSPLASHALLRRYIEAGMREVQTIVALQATPHRVVMSLAVHSGCRVRAANADDIGALLAIDAEAFDDFWRYGTPEFEESLATERVSVAEDDSGVVGYSSDSVWGSTCTIGRLAVAGIARRQGVGSLLLREAALRAHAEGVLLLSLCTQEENQSSRRLYARAGFHEVDGRYGLAIVDSAEGSQVGG